jgi:perosamine synthetase
MSITVPWARPHFGPEEISLLLETANSGWMSQGPRVRELEKVVASLLGTQDCLAMSSGTAALDVGLKVLNVEAGDEVLVPAFAYIATLNSVLYQGADPVFVDVDPTTLTMDPEDARQKITNKTKALIAIDYAGHAADWEGLGQLCREEGLAAIEDAAPSFGGKWRGKFCGTLTDFGTTSFHTAKVFTTVEGGMVFCSSNEQAHQVQVIRSQGESTDEKYVHPRLGHNYRMSDLHASIGLAQLGRFNSVLDARRTAAEYYSERLSGLEWVTTPVQLADARHAWFLYTIRVPDRDAVRLHMQSAGVETNISWPLPGYAQRHMKRFFRQSCPVTEQACESVLCLPMYYTISREEQHAVVSALIDAHEDAS